MMLERLGKLERREKIGLVLALLFVLGLLADRLVVRFVVARSEELSRQIELATKEAGLNRRVLQKKDAVSREWEQAGTLIERAESSAEAIDRMKDQIDKLAEASEVKLASWEERPPQGGEGGAFVLQSVSVRQFDARMDHLLVFLHRLGSEPGLLAVEELKLVPDKNAGRITGSMVITKLVATPADKSAPAGGKGA